MDHHRSIVIGIVGFLALIFALISVYLYIHDDKLDYYLYLYGDDPRVTPRLLVRVLSKDGHIVPNARMTADERPVDGILLGTDRPFRELAVTIGEKTYRYDIPFAELTSGRGAPPSDDWFTAQELEAARTVANAMKEAARRLYVLPDTVRMFGEADNRAAIFCMTDEGPCRDREVTLDGVPIPLLNGAGTAVLPLPVTRRATALFPDGSAVEVPYPYVGRMFSLAPENDHRLVLRTLVDAHNVHVDCWRGGRWQFTDVVTGRPDGEALPAGYALCDRIQVSFDSAGPDGNFLVWTRERAAESDIADPYYRMLLDDLSRYRRDLVGLLLERYPSCRFHRLATLYAGTDHERRFDERKRERLAVVWWTLAATALGGILLFTFFLLRRLTTVESSTDPDEEAVLVTLSPRRQKIIVAIIAAGLALFFIFLLAVLRNLA